MRPQNSDSRVRHIFVKNSESGEDESYFRYREQL